MADEATRDDGVVSRFDRRSGRGVLHSSEGRRFVFTARRNYLKKGVGVSFVAGRTRAYLIRRERLVALDGPSR